MKYISSYSNLIVLEWQIKYCSSNESVFTVNQGRGFVWVISSHKIKLTVHSLWLSFQYQFDGIDSIDRRFEVSHQHRAIRNAVASVTDDVMALAQATSTDTDLK